MKKRPIFLMLIALLLCVGMLTSCGDGTLPTTDTTDTTDGSTQSTDQTPPEGDPEVDRVGQTVDTLTLAKGGKTAYRLIYPLGLSGSKKEAVMRFRELFCQLTGAELEMCDDFEAEDEPRTLRTAKEIVIGCDTSREDLYTVDTGIFQKGYQIFVDRERLVIAASTEIGLWYAIERFFADSLGVDITRELPEQTYDCTLEGDYTAVRTIQNAAFFPLGDVGEGFRIVVDAGDEMQVRAAYGMQSSVELATGEKVTISTSARDADRECIVLMTDPTLKNGDWKLTVKGTVLTVSAGDYYGFGGAATYFRVSAQHGSYLQLTHGVILNENYRSTLDELHQSTAYAFTHTGDVRVMFHNALFNDALPAVRNRIQLEMFKIYMPDVLGLQELNNTKRKGAGENDISKLLATLGYAETIDPSVRNAYRTSETIPGADHKGYGVGGSASVKVDGVTIRTYYNHTPLFYNTSTTAYLDGGYYWYRHQIDAENKGNCGAGDCASKSATWGLFEDLETGGQYVVISTHMCTRSSGVRRQQGYELVALIEEILAKYDVPVFLGGDMNSTLYADNCKIFVEEGELVNLCTSDLATVYTGKTGTCHAYPVAYYDELMGKSTVMRAGTASLGPSGAIDHVFVRNLGDVEIRVFGSVVDEYAEMGSDHVPLFTDFSFSG